MNTQLETKRLLLRPFELADAEDVLAFGSHPEVCRYTCDDDSIKTVDDARRIITDVWHADYETHGYGRFAVVDKQTGRVFGFSGLKYLTDLEETDIGYRFLPEYWGKGIATEAGRVVMDYGRDELGLKNIIGMVVPENTASHRVLEKLGLRQAEQVEMDGQTICVYRQPGDQRSLKDISSNR